MFSHWNLFRIALIHREFVNINEKKFDDTPTDQRLVDSIKRQMGVCKRLQRSWYDIIDEYISSQKTFDWERYIIARAFVKRDQLAEETKHIIQFWFHNKELPENLREFLKQPPTKKKK